MRARFVISVSLIAYYAVYEEESQKFIGFANPEDEGHGIGFVTMDKQGKKLQNPIP